jgi:hypothetical protein
MADYIRAMLADNPKREASFTLHLLGGALTAAVAAGASVGLSTGRNGIGAPA